MLIEHLNVLSENLENDFPYAQNMGYVGKDDQKILD